METAEISEALQVLELGLPHCKWRLRPSTKRRLETDVMALCTGIRPVVMVDYGGKMPELQDYLCSLLSFCQKESPIFKHLRVLVIDDMIFLLHTERLAEYVKWSLSPDAGLLFIDLEQDPPKMITQSENSLVGAQLVSIWNLFAQHFPLEEQNKDLDSCNKTDLEGSSSATSANGASQNSGIIIDLSSCMQDTKISIPTLNGWLLGYPVIYLFSTEHIEDAIYNLSTKYIRIFKVLVCRKVNNPGKNSQQEEELMSFSVPYELSMGGSKEVWVEAFTGRVKAKWESSCRNAWKSMRMEVTECYPQAIVL